MAVETGLRQADTVARSASGGRPVVLATLGVPLLRSAATFAVDSAVGSGQGLIICNVTLLEPLRMSLVFGYDALEEFTPEVSASLRAPAELARSLGVRVERLRVRTPRPIEALLELVGDLHPGVLVFGPDPAALSPRRYERARRAVLDRAGCLVWAPQVAGPVS